MPGSARIDGRGPKYDGSCSVCGEFCAVRIVKKARNGKHTGIL